MSVRTIGAACAAALVTVFGFSAASAATYTFDFDQTKTVGWVESTTVGATEDSSVKINVRGGTYSDDKSKVSESGARIGIWKGAGLGVCGDWTTGGSRYDGCKDSNHRIDGSGTNDIALFELAKDYLLTSISFSYFDDYVIKAKYTKVKTCVRMEVKSGRQMCREYDTTWVLESPEEIVHDMFDLFADVGAGLTFQFSDTVKDKVALSGDLATSFFGVGASGKYDAFKVRAITVEDVPPAPVPLPAAGLLLLAGLGGLGALRARRRA